MNSGRKTLIFFVIIIVTLLSFTHPIFGQDCMDRIRAIEAFPHLVAARLVNARILGLRAKELRSGEDLRLPLDAELISSVAGSALKTNALNRGRLWIHSSFARLVEDWDRFDGRLDEKRIVKFKDLSELIKGFDGTDDIALLRTADIEALLKGGADGRRALKDGVILSPLSIHLEYLDQLLLSLVLIRDLKTILSEEGGIAACSREEFKALRILLESLLAWKRGFSDEEILSMIPHKGLSFEERLFMILFYSQVPIGRQDLDRIRPIHDAMTNSSV